MTETRKPIIVVGSVTMDLVTRAKQIPSIGQTLIGAELAQRYGLQDAGGKQPPSYREMLGAPRVPHPAIVR